MNFPGRSVESKIAPEARSVIAVAGDGHAPPGPLSKSFGGIYQHKTLGEVKQRIEIKKEKTKSTNAHED
jgi:hypothetical protein